MSIINKYHDFLNNCTEEQKEIIHAYIDNNYNVLQYYREYTMALDGAYTLDQLRIFVKILENLEHCYLLEKFDKEFPINSRSDFT